MTKRFTILFILALLSFFIITGCSNSNAEISGKWQPTTALINGETVKYGELGLEDDYFQLILTENGKCKARLAGVDEECNYTFNGTSLDLLLNDTEYKLDYQNSTLILNIDYGMGTTILTFAKVED